MRNKQYTHIQLEEKISQYAIAINNRFNFEMKGGSRLQTLTPRRKEERKANAA